MSEVLIDWKKSVYQEALRLIPQRFRELARNYADEVAAKVANRYDCNAASRRNAIDTTSECALNGLTFMRWHLLFEPERAELVEATWQSEGIVGLCRCMRELHQAERSLVVSGYGNFKQEEADSTLSRLHEKHRFTIVAVSHGFAVDRVMSWAKANDIQGILFHLDSDRELPSRLVGHYYRLLDMFAPAAVCVLSPDPLAMKMAACARMKGVVDIAIPPQFRQQGSSKPPVGGRQAGRDPQGPTSARDFRFSVLAGAGQDNQEVESPAL